MTLPVRDYAYNLHRVLWSGFDPATLPANPVWPNPQGLRATGAGLVLYRQGGTLVQCFLPNQLAVDHQIDRTNLRLYDNGWLIDAPIGYGDAHPINEAQGFGFGAMYARRLESANEIPDGFKAVWTTGGSCRGPWADKGNDHPRTFVEEMTTTIEYTHATRSFRIVDDFRGQEPDYQYNRPEPPYSATAGPGFNPNELEIIKGAPAIWQRIQHTPTEPTPTADGFTWQAKNGQTVTLTTTATKRLVEKCSGANMRGDFHAEELTGWLIRLCSDELPAGRIETTLGIN